jgi:cobyrinic acid a,c-diamide synthase
VTLTNPRKLARLAIAGLAGDSGKTLVSLGVTRRLKALGLDVAPFKKGPDFIDAQWLGKSAGIDARNLDTFLMSPEAILRSLTRAGRWADIAVIEGNRGLFDGMDAKGSHSTAELAKLIGAPVILVIDTTKVTRTVAAQVLGCKTLDPEVQLGGVILNRVGTSRQEAVVREAVENEAGVPVLGAVPRLSEEHLPSRHLGLVTSVEHPTAVEAIERVAQVVEQYVDLSALLSLARSAPVIDRIEEGETDAAGRRKARVGVLRDKAFSFYYPENLEALESAGADLVSISPLEGDTLPDLDVLYAGGGFPEVHAEGLSQNRPFREALARRIEEGLPVWAECGGLMYLSRGLVKDEAEYPMVGALPVVVEQTARPQGHGYVKARVDGSNPFLPEGTELTGHEFHYSRLRESGESVETVLEVERGVGIGGGRDGIRAGRVVAAYTHLHALGVPGWARGMVRAAAGEGP